MEIILRFLLAILVGGGFGFLCIIGAGLGIPIVIFIVCCLATVIGILVAAGAFIFAWHPPILAEMTVNAWLVVTLVASVAIGGMVKLRIDEVN